MCRLVGYIGAAVPLEAVVIAPPHSLLAQSRHARKLDEAVNGDGFGFAWYHPDSAEPGRYRDITPAWSDANILCLCRHIHSPLFVAHVRAATDGEVARGNCHPFVDNRWSMVHNGHIGHFALLRRALDALLSDELYAARVGTTDSELFFLLLLAHGLDTDPVGAIKRTLAAIRAAAATRGLTPQYRFSVLLSDGERLFGFRAATDPPAPTLFWHRWGKAGDAAGAVFASEPLDGSQGQWRPVPENMLFALRIGAAPQVIGALG